MRRLSLILFLALVCLPLWAQQMSVEDFTRLKGRQVEKMKDVALLDLLTDESGFTVLAPGNKPVEVEEGEGFIRLKVPHKTARLSIQHPTYGQLSWAAPQLLRKKRHYRAFLCTLDPTAGIKATRQWVIFRLSPQNTVLQLDSVSRPVRQDVAEYYLPVGEHQYTVEAPFYAPQEGTFTLSDTRREEVSVALQPLYSYLTVKFRAYGGALFGALYIDGAPIDWNDATSYRLAEGKHRVSCFWEGQCQYDTLIYVAPAEKRLLQIRKKDWYPRSVKVTDLKKFDASVPDTTAAPVADSLRTAQVKLTCKDPEADILVDRECMGKGQWEGPLPMGFHLLEARKDGKEGAPVRLMLEDAFPQEIALLAPGTGAGLVNLSCNVQGARILLDGQDVGTTPQILQLDASRSYELVLYKAGYKDKTIHLRPKANRQVDLYMKLKKRHR